MAALIGVVGCTAPDGGGPVSADDFPVVTCTVGHRPAVTEPLDTVEVVVEPGETRTVAYDDVEVVVTYDMSPQEGGALRIDAREPGVEDLLVRNLYQLIPQEAPASFAGDTGFTGLVYVYPPGGSTEVQYLCTADTEMSAILQTG